MFPFHIYFSHLCSFSSQKKMLVMTCVFECFQSHCHILKELYEFLCMMSAIIIFEESGFMFRFVRYELVTRSLEAGCTFEEVAEKIKSLKDECESFYNQIQMNNLT